MYKDLQVKENSNLELLFTCLVRGMNESIKPSLQVLYDDTLVFDTAVIYSSAANQSSINIDNGYNVNGWNQFRLFSR